MAGGRIAAPERSDHATAARGQEQSTRRSTASCGRRGIRQQTFDARRDFAAVDEGADRLGERRHRRCESRDLDERGRQRAARPPGCRRAAMRSARCSAADAQRRSIARAAGVAGNRSGAARISSRLRLSRARRVADLVRDAGRELLVGQRGDEAARDEQPRPQHADQRHHRRVDVDLETGMPRAGERDRTSRLHPDARAPDGTRPRAARRGRWPRSASATAPRRQTPSA